MRKVFGSNEQRKTIRVFGHLRLVRLPADRLSVFIESMVIHHEMRGKGLGSFFIGQAEKYCEDVLHLKSIFLSTYDSGEFYMKIGFELTPACCVYGDGEVNSVSKKIYLKKSLNYVEPEIIEEIPPDEVYVPTKDPNYQQQRRIESDIILSGFPYLLEKPREIVSKLCQRLECPVDVIRYYYSFETVSRSTGEKKFHLIISTKAVEARNYLMDRLHVYGIMCFQDLLDKVIRNEEDITIITHETRYTAMNYAIKKELVKMIIGGIIVDFKYEKYQFHAKPSEEEGWIIVKDMDVVNMLKTPVPEPVEEPEEEVDIWGDNESEIDSIEDKLHSLKQHFKTKTTEDDWITRLRRPSNIELEPLESYKELLKKPKPLFKFRNSIDEDENSEEDSSVVKSEKGDKVNEKEKVDAVVSVKKRKKFRLRRLLINIDDLVNTPVAVKSSDVIDKADEQVKVEENIENIQCNRKMSTSSYEAMTLGLNVDELF